jgi:hypothetical protein
MEHFPHLDQSKGLPNVTTRQISEEINAALLSLGAGPSKDSNELRALVERSRESLDEVKAQTEYQDQKSTRLLTVATFFVALAGLLISAFAQHHSIRVILGGNIDWWQVLAALVYLGFALFALSVVAGALVTFHATQTRFRYQTETMFERGEPPKSQIFFRGIVRASPSDWVGSFTQTTARGSVPARDLSLRYAKNYILESYLIAAKVADKMRYLEAAQSILAFSLKVLILWLPALAVISLIIPSDPKDDRPMKVEVTSIPSAAPMPYASPTTHPMMPASGKQGRASATTEKE